MGKTSFFKYKKGASRYHFALKSPKRND